MTCPRYGLSMATMPGKPVMGEARTRVVKLRALDEEAERWGAAAQREGMSLSDWLRRLANAAAPPAPKKKTRRGR